MSLTNASPEQAARSAKVSSRTLATLPVSARNAALDAVHDALADARESILEANAKDMELAKQSSASGELSPSIMKRLDLSRKGKFDDMLQGIKDVRALEDPVGRVDLRTELDDGLTLQRQTCPIGVLLIIFEARPEVIANIASLAIKSANAAILKGGKESTESFKAISTVISQALDKSDVPNDSIQLVTTRDAIDPLLELSQYIDLVIPRGSNDLVRNCQRKAHMPVLGHADGLCSLYIHSDADEKMAVNVAVDSKTDYPAACNAIETLLVNEQVLESVLPAVATALIEKGVSLRCDAAAKELLSKRLPQDKFTQHVQDVTENDFNTEFLDLTIAVRTIKSAEGVDAAIEHINTHGSHHTDAILTSSKEVADRFCNAVDSACKFWNCSTRFCDGMRFGFGTEVGISTNKLEEDLARALTQMKVTLQGTPELEATPDAVYQLVNQILAESLLPLLVENIFRLPFEARKDTQTIISNVFRFRNPGSNSPEPDALKEVLRRQPEIIVRLCNGYERRESASPCGGILKEAIKWDAVAAVILYDEPTADGRTIDIYSSDIDITRPSSGQGVFWSFFDWIDKSSFEVSADAFDTFRLLLTKHKQLVSQYISTNFDLFFDRYNNVLIKSESYVTKRQSIKLLGEVLLDRQFYEVMTRYVDSGENLKLIMWQLKDDRRMVQYEAFHVFKIFAANPNKSYEVQKFLIMNKQRLLKFLPRFLEERTEDEQFNDEKAWLVKAIG
ncbi:gamma-glutamyl phosphate reductase, partial [Hortaea werneckii]